MFGKIDLDESKRTTTWTHRPAGSGIPGLPPQRGRAAQPGGVLAPHEFGVKVDVETFPGRGEHGAEPLEPGTRRRTKSASLIATPPAHQGCSVGRNGYAAGVGRGGLSVRGRSRTSPWPGWAQGTQKLHSRQRGLHIVGKGRKGRLVPLPQPIFNELNCLWLTHTTVAGCSSTPTVMRRSITA
jgi:hypothetical protein